MVCSKCGKVFTDDVRFCTNCGTELKAATETEIVVAPEEETTENLTAEPEKTESTETVVGDQTEVAGEAEAVAEQAEAENAENEVPQESSEEETAVAVADNAETEVVTGEVTDGKKKKAKVCKIKLPKEEGQKSGKIKIGLALVAILLLIFIPVALSSGDEEYVALSDKSVLDVLSEDGNRFVYFADGDKLVLNDTLIFYSAGESQDKTVYCYTNENGELCIIKDGKELKTGIEDAKGIKVSAYGDTLVYFSDCEDKTYENTLYGYESKIEVGTLHLYYIKKGKDITVADDVVVTSAVLSPDGETVAYVTDYDATDDFKGYYSVKGKKQVEVGKEKRVFAIADKGAYVYYVDGDRIYAQKKNKDAEKLASDIYTSKVLMNADCTEMLFTNDGKTYITVKAGEKQKVSGNVLRKILLNNDALIGSDSVRFDTGSVTVTYTGVETLKEQLYYTDIYSIEYLLDKWETERIASNAEYFVVSDDGESLVYIDGTDVVKVTDFDKSGVKTDLNKDEEARYVYADGDLKYVYFLNRDKELFYIKGKKVKKIADDVTSATMSSDGEFCYYVVEKEKFYCSKKGGKGKELFREDDAKITCESNYGISCVEIILEDKTEVYRLDGKKMKLVYIEEVYHDSIDIEDLPIDESDWQDIYDSLFDY